MSPMSAGISFGNQVKLRLNRAVYKINAIIILLCGRVVMCLLVTIFWFCLC